MPLFFECLLIYLEKKDQKNEDIKLEINDSTILSKQKISFNLIDKLKQSNILYNFLIDSNYSNNQKMNALKHILIKKVFYKYFCLNFLF